VSNLGAKPDTILFATANPFKAKLFEPVFRAHGLTCLTLADIETRYPIAETGHTARENALLKARAYHGLEWPFVFGDDAGMEVDALDGEPGVQARRWGGHFPDTVSDETWLDYLLERLEGIPLAQRTARYVAAWVLIAPDGTEHIRNVYHEFTIAEQRLRPIIPGSPMSAVELHYEEHLARRQEHIATEWQAWDILPRVLNQYRTKEHS